MGEPAYRELSGDDGDEPISVWNIDDPDRTRFVVTEGGGHFEICDEADSGDCDIFEDESWTTDATVPRPYGGWSSGHLGPAGGWVASVGAYLKFARRFRTNQGTPGQGATGTGSPLAGIAAYIGGTASSHNGSLPGTWNFVWQLAGGVLQITMPTRTAVWDEDLPAAAQTDNQGLVVVNEGLTAATSCTPPGDVAIVVLLNQRSDYRAPRGATISGASNSTTGSVYGRIRDFAIGGVCQVTDWPVPEAINIVAPPPDCD